jgi:oligoribonuclease NrnB/cAMP/cGMP phosphodiesterase (DHH superfamily)
MDGSGAAILFRHAGGNPKNIHWVKPGYVDEAIADSKVSQNPNIPILFVDVCPYSEDAVEFLHNRGNFHVIDHHGSAEKYADRPGFVISRGNQACGTEMFRHWLFQGGMKQFGEHEFKRFANIIDDHDRWRLQHPFSIQMPRFFAFTGQQEFVERFMDVKGRFSEEKLSYWTPFEAEVYALIDRTTQRRFLGLMTKFSQRRIEFDGKKILVAYVVSGEVNCSELLHMYMEENPDVDMAVQINLDYNRLSLRSNGKVNITKFAAQYDGGGSPNSGGHPMPDDLTSKIIELVHRRD